jgi:tetratricopeptide (TPR) repeat protein
VARAFIVRPFGEKKFGKDQVAVNFDDVEKALIEPALKDLNIEGRTTAEILESGNIRNDMFQRLLVSDLVIADLTVHNANVFYELGIRHAFREKRTFLIYSRIGEEKLPFDLQTDRYLAYDHKEPEKSLPAFIAGLRRTLASDDKDSPVFRLLPELRSQDPGRFMVVPQDFRDEIQHAQDRGYAGMLALMAAEVAGLLWEREGLRLAARAQCRSNFLSVAKDTRERVLRIDENDWEANLELGSIYQTLGELDKSNLSLKRVLENPAAEPKQRAEAHALRARNAMQYWRRAVTQAKAEAKQAAALLSPRLDESYNEFRRAFEQDLRCYGFGIDALARLTVWMTLAERLQDVWEDAHESPEEAARHGAALKEDLARLTSAVNFSVEIAKRQAGEETDINLRIGRAQLLLLTSKKSERVKNAYVGVVEYASPADIGEVGRFLTGFEEVDVLASNVAAGWDVVSSRATVAFSNAAATTRVLLFRGYGRELLSREAAVRKWIRSQIEAEVAAVGKPNLLAIAGGCCGGDILFHEVCQELNIPCSMHLPLPPDQYVPRFVQCHDPQWIERFRKLVTTVPMSVLQASADMPKWLKDREAYTFLERWNSWMLSAARSTAPDVTLVAICDESRADEEGVADLVKKAKQTGAKPIIANPAMFIDGA